MAYLDGFVIPVPTANREVYRRHEEEFWPQFRAMGALSLVVGWGDDVPPGKQTDFFRSVAATPEETVVLALLTWPDKATRDAAYKKMMEDPAHEQMEMPFDGRRMIYGGFTPIFSAGV